MQNSGPGKRKGGKERPKAKAKGYSIIGETFKHNMHGSTSTVGSQNKGAHNDTMQSIEVPGNTKS